MVKADKSARIEKTNEIGLENNVLII